MAPITDEKKKQLILHIIRLETNIAANINEELEDAGIKADVISAADITNHHAAEFIRTVSAMFLIPETIIDEAVADETR